jgi:phage terminase large subunit
MYEYEKDTAELIQLAGQYNFDKKKIMYCDSAEPDRIQMWCKAGYKARPVNKGGSQGSVKAQIDYLKQHKIHINACCTNTTKEIQQWKWKKDRTTGLYTDEPVDIFDDAMAALRYSTEPYRTPERKGKTMSKSALGL